MYERFLTEVSKGFFVDIAMAYMTVKANTKPEDLNDLPKEHISYSNLMRWYFKDPPEFSIRLENNVLMREITGKGEPASFKDRLDKIKLFSPAHYNQNRIKLLKGMQKTDHFTGTSPPIKDNYIRHAISPLTDEEMKILMAPVITENKNKKKLQQHKKYINEFWKNLAKGDGKKTSEEILREFVKSAAERMKSDDVIDDVEKVMEKFKSLQSKLEGEFGELVAKAKKVKEAKEKNSDKTKKGVEEMKDKPKVENIRMISDFESKRVRRIR